MHKRKKKIKYSRLLFLIIFNLLLILGIVKIVNILKNKEIKEEEVKEEIPLISKYKAIVTDSEEQNKDTVKKYFVNGMDTNDYKNTIEKIDNYIDVSGEYNELNYDFEKHYHYYELEEIYNNLAKSSIVNLEIIGKSVDGRNIYSIEIGNGDTVTMFEAGIHASEIASPLFITKFMIDLVNGYEANDKEVKEFLNKYKIVVLPVANPDGYEITIFGGNAANNKDLFLAKATSEQLDYLKCNANGVDINRNFPSQTSGLYYKKYELDESVSLTKSYETESYYPGETLGSEPETRAIMYWQNKWLPYLKSYVALHSAGQSIYNGKPYLSDEYNYNSNVCAEIVGEITDYFVLDKIDEQAGEGNDGTSSEYMAETLSGFIFSSKTGRLSTDYYKKYYSELKYKNTCVIVIEALEEYTNNLKIIKKEYYNHKLEEAYKAIIERE